MAEMSRALTLHEAPIVGNRRLDGLVGEDALRSAERRIAENGGHKLVADLDGRVIGQVLLTWERHGACVREDLKDYGEVVELFVSEAHRGKGVGRTLLTEAERLTREKGFGHMLLGVVRGNTIAERAYERFGFTPYATDLAKAIGA
jgi:GNAT superfamily N-acetyltransferase